MKGKKHVAYERMDGGGREGRSESTSMALFRNLDDLSLHKQLHKSFLGS